MSFAQQSQGILWEDFQWLRISRPDLHHLQLQKLFPPVYLLGFILLLDLQKEFLVQHLLQKHNMKGRMHYFTHQASSHQQQIPLLVGAHFQVCISFWNFTIQLDFGFKHWFLYFEICFAACYGCIFSSFRLFMSVYLTCIPPTF